MVSYAPLGISQQFITEPTRISQQQRQQGLLSAQLSGQEEERGIRLEALKQDMLKQKRAEQRQEKIGLLSQEALSGSSEAQKALLAADPVVGSKINEYMTEQKEQLGQGIVNALQQFSNIPSEMQEGLRQHIVGLAEKAYPDLVTPDVAQQLRSVPLDQFPNFGLAVAQGKPLGQEAKARSGGGIVTLVGPNGEQVGIDTQDAAQRERMTQLLSQGYTQAPTRQETGGPGSFSGTKKEFEELREAEISAINAISTIDDLSSRIRENPDAFTSAGGLARFSSGLAEEGRALARTFGIDVPDEILNAEQYADTFKELGVKSAAAQGAMLDVALAYAAASGLGSGRALTDKDIERSLRRVGADGLLTPEARLEVLDDVRSIIERNFRNRYRVLSGNEYSGQLPRRPQAAQQRSAAPTEGQVEDGYRFLGGDPSDPNNWEQVK